MPVGGKYPKATQVDKLKMAYLVQICVFHQVNSPQ